MRMTRFAGASFLLIVSASSATVQSSARLEVSCDTLVRRRLPEPGDVLVLQPAHGGLLTIEEHGQEANVRGRDVIEIATPPRQGRFFVTVGSNETLEISRARPWVAKGDFSVILDCNPDQAALALRSWAAGVQLLDRNLSGPLTTEGYDRLAPQLEAARASAPTGYAHALAEHLRAQALLMAGRSADAAEAFDVAKAGWTRLHDRERAQAALVAEAEDLLRAGKYENVLSITRSLDTAPSRDQYFGVRLENSRCLALQYLSRLSESAACYKWTLQALDDLGESLERISTQQDYALVERDRGNLDLAATLGKKALAEISDRRWDGIPGSDVPIVRGRIERLLSDLAEQRGDVAEGLRRSQTALLDFEKAHHVRWQANTLIRIAAIYSQIGAYADALDAVDSALERLSVRDAPARVATAELTKADINLSQGRSAQSVELAVRAESLFESLQMPFDAATAKLTIAEARIASGENDAARAVMQSIHGVPPPLSNRAKLVLSELSLVIDHHDANSAELPGLDEKQPRPLTEWLRVQAVIARQLQTRGQPDAALRRLEKAAAYMSELGRRTGNPVIQIAIERRTRMLLSTAMPLILSIEEPERQAEEMWHWIQLTDVRLAAPNAPARNRVAGEFDRALAESLLRPAYADGKHAPRDDRMEQHLLKVVTDSFAPAGKPARHGIEPSLREFRQTLADGTMLLAFVPTATDLIVLAASRDKNTVLVVNSRAQQLQERTEELGRRITEYDSVAAIDQQAGALSADLLGALHGVPVPKHLMIFAPEPLNGIPWPMLRWPGSTQPLVDTTSVSLISPAEATAPPTNEDGPLRIHVFAAPLEAGTEPDDLQPLTSAASELSSIAGELRQKSWQIAGSNAPTRDSVVAALTDAGSWVHIASHGGTKAEYVGRSGLWLPGTDPSGRPELLSWVDIVETGIKAEVVVLNACALASSSRYSLSASTGFADAVLRAGARDVVAALWPVSDTAAYLWASHFYSRLPSHPTTLDIAEALRLSMLRLRDTRAYRHPKYWASLVHLARIPLSSSNSPALPQEEKTSVAQGRQ